LALPALFLFVSRIRIERSGRQQLLMGIEKNDRTYVFDPGFSTGSSADNIINASIQNMRKASDFISGLAKGNYAVNWEGWSQSHETLNQKTLAGTLLNLREQLRKAKQIEDQRNWSNEGLAKFMEVIRNNQNDFQKLVDRSISFMAKQVQVYQGGFYTPDKDGAKVLRLVSCYAFDKNKLAGTTIDIGSGLVGQAFQSGEVIKIKDVPTGYIKVSSGLGDAAPRHLIIIPMKYDLRTMAIVELASFTALEDYQIDFLLRIGSFLSAAILNIQTSEKMSVLSHNANTTHGMSSRVA
jgi:putative methionine-R-sulfoxide reductase with GAF domain